MMVKSDTLSLEFLLNVCFFFVKNNFPLIVNKSSSEKQEPVSSHMYWGKWEIIS